MKWRASRWATCVPSRRTNLACSGLARRAADWFACGTEISGALNSDTLVEANLAGGHYDGASIEAWLVNWANPAQNFLVDVGVFGEVRRNDHGFTVEIRGLATALDEERGRHYQATCSADLGDARCGVALASAAYSASATVAAADGLTLTGTGLAGYADGWFSGGEIVFTSGANAGSRAEVKQHRLVGATASLLLWSGLASPPQSGDAFTVRAGCDKAFATCKTKFNNQLNFRGFPHIPGPDAIFTYAVGADPTFDGGPVVP